jgi:hypothetical protein
MTRGTAGMTLGNGGNDSGNPGNGLGKRSSKKLALVGPFFGQMFGNQFG